VGEWHPIMAAVEKVPATWDLVDPGGRVYGRVELRRTADGPRYRCSRDGEVLGWATSLRLACARLHDRELRAHGPGAAPPEMFLPRGGQGQR